MISKTPEPPYYAVIFTSVKKTETVGYDEMAKQMEDLALKQTGFLGIESAQSGIGISVSYWKDLKSIKLWKENAKHQLAQQQGKEKWYKQYKTRIAKVERDYGFENLNLE